MAGYWLLATGHSFHAALPDRAADPGHRSAVSGECDHVRTHPLRPGRAGDSPSAGFDAGADARAAGRDGPGGPAAGPIRTLAGTPCAGPARAFLQPGLP